jgi:hypothetical protein
MRTFEVVLVSNFWGFLLVAVVFLAFCLEFLFLAANRIWDEIMGIDCWIVLVFCQYFGNDFSEE